METGNLRRSVKTEADSNMETQARRVAERLWGAVTEILILTPTGRLTVTIIRQIRRTLMCRFTPTKLANISKVITVYAAYMLKPT